jgi:quercetin dioxygenase-like cupin family protein
MQLSDIPFGTTDWQSLAPTEHKGEAGLALWRTRELGPAGNRIRVRLVEYSPGYVSDHWCEKGHILLCLEGELATTLRDGRVFTLKPGQSYQVADGPEGAHRSASKLGARLFIVD